MKIHKAIKILTIHQNCDYALRTQDFYDALKLSVEALKRVVNQRSTHAWSPEALLPGEDPK